MRRSSPTRLTPCWFGRSVALPAIELMRLFTKRAFIGLVSLEIKAISNFESLFERQGTELLEAHVEATDAHRSKGFARHPPTSSRQVYVHRELARPLLFKEKTMNRTFFSGATSAIARR